MRSSTRGHHGRPVTPGRWSPSVTAVTAALLFLGLLTGLTGLTGVAQAVPTAPLPIPDRSEPVQTDVHVVVLRGRPAAGYLGTLAEFPRTAPAPGERFDRTRDEVLAYAARLHSRQDRVLAAVGDPEVLYRYTTALNGFAARLTETEAKRVAALPAVRMVEPARVERLTTVDSPETLGLPAAWERTGGPDRAGRGTVIGVVDSGIWPENPSFAGLPLPDEERRRLLPGFQGTCPTAEQWSSDDCNDKVVSARWFVHGFGEDNLARSEHLSPRDGSGHGSHTAAIAGGNDGVRVDVDGQPFGAASGVAPGARIAAYKACWTAPDPEQDGCHTADLLAAVDQAVADGVDVLNYSVAHRGDQGVDAVELAFLSATAAGVFVAAPAGNDGPSPGSVHHGSPWVTTVGAATHHSLEGAATLGDGTQVVGSMVSDEPVTQAPLTLAGRAAAPTADLNEARLCEIGSLDASRVQGHIVVCDRGSIARVDKSAAVARAGGVGMILANPSPDSVDADFHAVPTVHLDAAAAELVKDYARSSPRPTVSFDPEVEAATEVPRVADFSSRGPSEETGGAVLKPDLVAPGVSVLAAVAPPTSSGRLWDLRSGTSMSTPHVAGLAALLAAEKPDWGVARLRSAMMTTARSVGMPARPFAEGAGMPEAADVLDPGITFDLDADEYRRYVRGDLDAGALNLPSIAVGALTGTARVVRRVTNVSGVTETYTPRMTGIDNAAVTVRPASLKLAPGETGRFVVTLTALEGLAAGETVSGVLTWTGLSHQARIPVVARADAVSAPREVEVALAEGSAEVQARSGVAAPGELTAVGLVPDTPAGLSLTPGDFDPRLPVRDRDTERFDVEVPADAEILRVQLEGHRAADDMDLHVYRDGEPVGESSSPGSDETVTLIRPPAGEYAVYVTSISADNGSTTSGQLYQWVVTAEDAGNLAVIPQAARPGIGGDLGFQLEWGGLDGVARWFGAVRYGDTGEMTLVSLR